MLTSIILMVFSLPFLDSEVVKEIDNLGSNQFVVRQRATEKLIKMEEKALFLTRWATLSQDPEVRIRAEKILEAYYNVQPTSYSYIPYIDRISEKDPARAEIMSTYLPLGLQANMEVVEVSAPYVKCWNGYRLATRFYVRDMMEQGKWTRKDAIKFMDSLVPIEKAYLKKLEDEAKERENQPMPPGDN